MLISLDFDDTFTKHPAFWLDFLKLAEQHQVNVICCTLRFDTPENLETLREHLPADLPILFCNHNYKRETAKKAGLKVDVWIDDMPEAVGP